MVLPGGPLFQQMAAVADGVDESTVSKYERLIDIIS